MASATPPVSLPVAQSNAELLTAFRDAAAACSLLASAIAAASIKGFSDEEEGASFRKQWLPWLKTTWDNWKVAASCTFVADGRSLIEVVESTVQPKIPSVYVGRRPFVTAHAAVGYQTKLAWEWLMKYRSDLPPIVDLQTQIKQEWGKSLNSLATAAPTAGQPGGKSGDGAADESAFVPAATLWKERFSNYKAAKGFLDAHLEIRTRKPGKQRLEIHAGDWVKYWAAQHVQGFDALDEAAPPEITSMVVENAKGRYDELHTAKQQHEQPDGDSAIKTLTKRIQAGK